MNIKMSLRWKIIIGFILVAFITYFTSAVFIFFLKDYFTSVLHISMVAYTSIVLLLGICWCGILGFIFSQVILKPLSILEREVHKVSNGNLQVEFNFKKSGDEIESLGKSFTQMLNNLREIIQEIEAHAGKTEAEVVSLREISSTVNEVSLDVKKEMENINVVNENCSSLIAEMITNLNNTELIAKDVHYGTNLTEKSSDTMIHKLTESTEYVGSLLRGINNINDSSEKSLKIMQGLTEKINDIEKVLSLVGDFSKMTDILALNASIEAARAGELGKGFSVVAKKVREIAEQSSTSVVEIKKIINNIKNEAGIVEEHIHKQFTIVKDESVLGVETKNKIDEMKDIILDVKENVKCINMSVNTQMKSIQKLSDSAKVVTEGFNSEVIGIAEINKKISGQQKSIKAEDSIVNRLKEDSNKLTQVIHKFRVN